MPIAKDPPAEDSVAAAAAATSARQTLQREKAKLRRIGVEQERRAMDPLRVYEPMPEQDRFHKSWAAIRIFQKGNRAGGSAAGAVEVARAARGKDPYEKYSDTPVRIWIVVYVETNIGSTIYRMLFEPGLFDIIRDPQTKQWRAFDPDNPWDRSHKRRKRKAPPLIPKDEIKEWSWKDAKARIFNLCRLHNGSEISALCSSSEPRMGDPIHLAWIDEDLKAKKVWMQELTARTADYEGFIVWTANPKGQNDALQKWIAEAEAEKGKDTPAVEVFRLKFSENKYLSQRTRDLRMNLWRREGEDIARARDTGDFVFDSLLMYPEFSIERHGIPNVLDPECLDRNAYDHNIDWFLRTYEVPGDWTRFLWIDPGFNVTAGIFFAVPPPEIGDFVVAYDEVYLVNRPLIDFTRAVQQKTGGITLYSMGADYQFTQQHEWTSGQTRIQQMSDMFRQLEIRSVSTGFGFRKGSPDTTGRQSMLRTWLALRTTPDGKLLRPKFCVLRDKRDPTKAVCRNMVREFGLTMKVFQHDEAKDKRVNKDCHTVDCTEYAAHDTSLRFHRIASIGKYPSKMESLMNYLNPESKGDGHIHLAAGPPRPWSW